MPQTTPLARYLFSRLRQQHVRHIYGVPGDFTLRALDHTSATGLRFVGCCNELNAGYAADGYARVRRNRFQGQGLGALFTTYGVGELSAANAVAGSYAEYVPVVHVVGTPSRRALDGSAAAGGRTREHLHVHHTLGDGRAGIFRQIASKFTVAQLNLADVMAADVPERIDEVLTEALTQCRPVYIELPSDIVDVEVDSSLLETPLYGKTRRSDMDTQTVPMIVNTLLEMVQSAKRPMVLVDRGDGVTDMKDDINEFIRHLNLPTFTMPSGLGMIDSELPCYFGTHSGQAGIVNTMPFLESADLVLAFGPMFADTQTLGWQTVPHRQKMVLIGKNHVDGNRVDSREVLLTLLRRLHRRILPGEMVDSLRDIQSIPASKTKPADPIDQTKFYRRLNTFLRPNDAILLGNATPILGGRDLVLPPRAQATISGMWYSIGHMLPASLGAAQAHDGHTILLDGDGSFQVSAQELSTIIHQRTNVTIFIMNNGGYTYERYIHGMDEVYNDVAPWSYLNAPQFFGAPADYPIQTHQVKTWGDLDNLLEDKSFRDGRGLKLVDVIVNKYDIPEAFRVIFQQAKSQL